ncbi:hypothetical protein D910_04189 [Dendroctonus ponderosae]|uniref:MANSC domain-containing protein n=1 Tax=Dendroctonus ponderosae TaxID=77166 RepID=U4U368_DENPD|nr:hypothetical protein D910_04189 [Dendroctonus ponderosae]
MAPYTWSMGLLLWLAVSVRPQEVLPAGAPKTSDIDLQTCIANFNVHKDKIIRTHDSQNMGARYLNEADLGSREECLRLCCETDDCDVFVFQQSAGNCYLFQCGPPEDFKCKFTQHVNYSSAVLAISRRGADLENQIKLTKHVQELAKLRAKPDLEAPRPSTTPPPPLVAQETEQAHLDGETK